MRERQDAAETLVLDVLMLIDRISKAASFQQVELLAGVQARILGPRCWTPGSPMLPSVVGEIMIEATHDEIDFIRRLEERGGEIVLQGEIRLLKIGRLVPEYVTCVTGSSERARFRLTEKGRELARKIIGDSS